MVSHVLLLGSGITSLTKSNFGRNSERYIFAVNSIILKFNFEMCNCQKLIQRKQSDPFYKYEKVASLIYNQIPSYRLRNLLNKYLLLSLYKYTIYYWINIMVALSIIIIKLVQHLIPCTCSFQNCIRIRHHHCTYKAINIYFNICFHIKSTSCSNHYNYNIKYWLWE